MNLQGEIVAVLLLIWLTQMIEVAVLLYVK
jgi:hypothetical protein